MNADRSVGTNGRLALNGVGRKKKTNTKNQKTRAEKTIKEN
jgi:hypothetical protein